MHDEYAPNPRDEIYAIGNRCRLTKFTHRNNQTPENIEMDSSELFVALLHRLRRYPEALVLHAVLAAEADVDEYKVSTAQLALGPLSDLISRQQVRYALDRLAVMGLISVRYQVNYRALITAHRDAVMAFLRKPVSAAAPGLKKGTFPFLTALNTVERDETETQAEDAIKKARNSSSGSGGDAEGGKPGGS